jgi:hypothetical protein
MSMESKKLWIYKGPVKSFNKIINDNYRCGSQAVSEKRALANIAFSFKKKYKLVPNTKIELDARYLSLEV